MEQRKDLFRFGTFDESNELSVVVIVIVHGIIYGLQY